MREKSIHEIAAATKHTLLTNVSFVEIHTPIVLRLYAHALLIEEGAISFGDPVDRLRGFGTDAGLGIFSHHLGPGSLPFKIEGGVADQSMIMLGEKDGEQTATPIFSGSILTFGDGWSFFLQTSKSNQPLDVYANVGDIEKVWGTLACRVADYWDAPYMPVPEWMPPARGLTARRLRYR
jgi:hypothetical protein